MDFFIERIDIMVGIGSDYGLNRFVNYKVRKFF